MKLSLVMKLLSATIMESAIVGKGAIICGEAVIGRNTNISDSATVYGATC